MAFKDGVKAFQEMTKDPKKKIIAWYTMQDVVDKVQKAAMHYHRDRILSRVREYLSAFFHRVMHYGSVLDVLVQHYPGYTSLAWGALKIVFGVSLC